MTIDGQRSPKRRVLRALLLALSAATAFYAITFHVSSAPSLAHVRHPEWIRRQLTEPMATSTTTTMNVSWLQWLKNVLHWGTPTTEPAHLRHLAQTALSASAYNETKAVYLAYVTSVAYCQAHHIRNWSCSPCALVKPLENVTVVVDKKDSFQGLVGYSEEHNAVTVAFRGSMDIPNWIDNLTFIKKKAYARFPEVRVHEGFYWVYESVASQVVPAVRALLALHKSASVVITGHSLGGAVAALCAFDLSLLENITVQAVYTFGEPRVGNANFSTLLNGAIGHIYRVTHFRDIVPHLPPTWVGFQHSTQEVFYDEFATTYRLCDPHDGEDPLCSDACSPFGCTSVVDHLTYVNVTMSHLIC